MTEFKVGDIVRTMFSEGEVLAVADFDGATQALWVRSESMSFSTYLSHQVEVVGKGES